MKIIRLLTVTVLAVAVASGTMIVYGQTVHQGATPVVQEANPMIVLPPCKSSTYRLVDLAQWVGDASGTTCWVDVQCRSRRLLIVLPNEDQKISLSNLKQIISDATGLRWWMTPHNLKLTRMSDAEWQKAIQDKKDERLNEARHLVTTVNTLAPGTVPVPFDTLQTRYLEWSHLKTDEQTLFTRLGSQAKNNDTNPLRALVMSDKIKGAFITFRFDLMATLVGDPFPGTANPPWTGTTIRPWTSTVALGDLSINQEIPTFYID